MGRKIKTDLIYTHENITSELEIFGVILSMSSNSLLQSSKQLSCRNHCYMLMESIQKMRDSDIMEFYVSVCDIIFLGIVLYSNWINIVFQKHERKNLLKKNVLKDIALVKIKRLILKAQIYIYIYI